MATNNSIGHISSLPVHISIIKVNLTITGELAVIRLVVSPTLLIADATSNKTCGMF